MKRYAVVIEYFDYNDSYDIRRKTFNSLLIAKIYFYLHKKKEYTLIKLTDTLNKKDILKFVKK